MSAPHTDPEQQKKEHRAPLIGIRTAVFWALGLLVLLILYIFLTGNDPEGSEEVIDGRTGAVEESGNTGDDE